MSTPITPGEQAILVEAAPLVQERIGLLGEAPGMMGFLFTDAARLEFEEAAVAALFRPTPVPCSARPARRSTGSPLNRGPTTEIEEALRGALIDGLGLKPRVAFGPVRTAVSGRRVSPPLFESMQILGKVDSLHRIDRLAELVG